MSDKANYSTNSLASSTGSPLQLPPITSTTPPLQFWKELSDLGCGSLAGMLGKIIEHPFDTIKVRLQTQSQFAGPINCLLATLRHEGVPGLFRGLPAPTMGSMMENATLFLAYRHCQDAIRWASDSKSNQPLQMKGGKEELSLIQLGLAGGLAGAMVSFVLTPFELIKCRVQVANLSLLQSTKSNSMVQPAAQHGGLRNPSTLSMFLYTLRNDGLGAFYRGHTGTLLRESGGGMAYFGIYEGICRMFLENYKTNLNQPIPLTKSDLPAWQLMSAGALAGIGFNLSLFPADAIKSRIQTAPHKVGFLTMGKLMWQSAGIRGFYRGCGITLIRSIPSNACILYTYETLSHHVKKIIEG